MPRLTRRLLGATLVFAAWWVVTAPAWADAPPPGPAQDAYYRDQAILRWATVGCCAISVLLVVVAVALLIRYLVRRQRDTSVQTAAPYSAPTPPAAPPAEPPPGPTPPGDS